MFWGLEMISDSRGTIYNSVQSQNRVIFFFKKDNELPLYMLISSVNLHSTEILDIWCFLSHVREIT